MSSIQITPLISIKLVLIRCHILGGLSCICRTINVPR